MPVRQLDGFLADRHVLRTEPAAVLAGLRLGVEAAHWLKRLPVERDAALVPLGAPVAFSLRAAIERDVAWLRARGIHPVFVFPGLAPRRDTVRPPAPDSDPRAAKRNAAWDALLRGTASYAPQWGAPGPLSESYAFAMRVLMDLGCEVLRAPYAASAQLVYLHSHATQPVHAVYAGAELLMFPQMDRVVTHLDHRAETLTWADKPALLQQTDLTADQFLDCCLLAGFDWIPTYAPLINDPNLAFNWPTLVTMVRTVKSGAQLIHQIGAPGTSKQQYLDLYGKVRAVVRHHPVLTLSGAVELLDAAHAPGDMQEIVGPKLPRHVYHMLARGVISPTWPTALVSGLLPEFAPMCNGETAEYRAMLDAVRPLRGAALSAFLAQVPPPLRHARVAQCTWFAPNKDVPLHADPMPLHWHWPADVVEAECASHEGAVDAVWTLRAVSNASTAQATLGPAAAAPSTATSTPHQQRATAYAAFLQVAGYIDAGTHRPTPRGRAYLLAATRPTLTLGPRAFTEELLVAGELLRLGVLHAQPYAKTYHPVPAGLDKQTDWPHVLLITRIAAILAPAKPIPHATWSGPLNRDVLVAASLARLMSRTLRLVAEGVAHAAGSATGSEAGAVFHYGAANTQCAAVALCVLAHFAPSLGTCGGCVDAPHEVARALEFFDAVAYLAKGLRGHVDRDVWPQFAAASDWLAKRDGSGSAASGAKGGAPQQPSQSQQPQQQQKAGGGGSGSKRGGPRGKQ